MTDDLVSAWAAMVGLPIAEDHLPGVAANLRRLLEQARLVTEVEVTPQTEPAPIFRP